MKRAALSLACLVVLATLMVPVAALATESKATPKTTAAATTPTTTALITYPAPEPDVSAEEAKADTPWMKSGDGLNLFWALSSLAAIGGIIAWGIWASRKASAPA